MRATVTFLMKSGREITVECDEESSTHTAQSLTKDFDEATNFSKMVTFTIGDHVIYCREIEAIRFWSPTT